MQELIKTLQSLEPTPLPLSYSKAALLLKCGRFFKLRYLEKHPESAEAVLDPEAARVGKFLHTVLEYCVSKAKSFGFDIDSVDFGLTWKQVSDQMSLCHCETNRAMEMRVYTRNLLIKLFELVNRYGLAVTPELKFCMSKSGIVLPNVPYDKRFFIGYLDFWGITSNRRVGLLLDYKSHARSAENADTLALQTKIYLYFMFLMHPSVQTIQSGGAYLPEDLLDLHPIARRQDLPLIENDVKKFLQSFVSAFSAGSFVPIKSKQCNWCGYRNTCPLHSK